MMICLSACYDRICMIRDYHQKCCLCADLATWHYEGLIFNGTAQMTGMPVDPPFRIERPKVQCLHNTSYDVMQNASGITHIVPCISGTP